MQETGQGPSSGKPFLAERSPYRRGGAAKQGMTQNNKNTNNY